MATIEDRLRSHLEATAEDMHAPPLDLAFPARRTRRRRRNRMGVLAATAVLGLGVGTVALSTLGGDEQGGTETIDQPERRDPDEAALLTPEPEPTESAEPHALDLASAVTVFEHDDGSFAALATGDDGDLWTVSPASELPARVTRLDPETGEVTARVALPGEARAFGVLSGGGAVWVPCTEGFLHRIDPATNTVVASVLVNEDQPQGWFGGGAATADAVWLSQFVDGRVPIGQEPTNVMRRVDPASNTVVGFAAVQGALLDSAVAAGDTAVWVEAGASVNRVDPATNEVVAIVPSPEPFREDTRSVIDVVADGDRVWMIGTTYAARIDPDANEVVATVTLPEAASGAVLIDGFLLIGSAGNTLYRIDTSTMTLDAVIDLGPEGPPARHLTTTDDYLFFDNSEFLGGPETRLGRVTLDALTVVVIE